MCCWRCILPSDLLRSRFLTMFSGLLWNVVAVLYRQRYIPNAALGRVNSIYRFLAGIHCCFGALASGAIVVWVKPELGRGLALRIPFFVTAVVLLQYFFM